MQEKVAMAQASHAAAPNPSGIAVPFFWPMAVAAGLARQGWNFMPTT
jgi:hypothetical protein